ncbi:MAG: hypothetical protein A2289_22465 [Deltaproteobacteria bacterium RIFOXYA12_FULL_58_15]|nr:MAG: hypothetical protein A2289_22465 [Deltaproteobacteria bacterium RIFOXYA12_FULL_58_15]
MGCRIFSTRPIFGKCYRCLFLFQKLWSVARRWPIVGTVCDLAAPRYIDTETELAAWVKHCSRSRFIAVDTESDSFHHYPEKVCLLQMSVGGEDAIIDVLALPSLELLGPLFADPKHIKIFHDACYDLICLGRDFGFKLQGLWDTMVASRLLGNTNFGLATILRERFGHEANKRLQRSDWTRRPLSPEQISYARCDTHYLERLVEMMSDELRAAKRLAWAEEDFERLPAIAQRISERSNGASADGFWRIRGIRNLSPVVLGRIRALHAARHKIAARLDRPPFKVFGDSLLVEIAMDPPKSLQTFASRPGLRRGGIDLFGQEIVNAVRKATPVKECPPASSHRRRSGRFLDPAARDRYEALRNVRKVEAAKIGLEPEVMLGNAVLEDLARLGPAEAEQVREVPELQGWRGPIITEPLIALIRG